MEELEEENHDFGLLVRQRRRSPARFTCGAGPFSPQPSLALLRFWQGRIELALRVFCFALSSFCLAASVLSKDGLDFDSTGEELVDSSASESQKVVVWVVCTASIAMLTQLLVMVGRFVNFKFATSHSSLIHVLDVIASVVFTSAYFTLTIPLIVFCGELAHFEQILPGLDPTLHYQTLRIKYYINIVLCSACLTFFLFLSIWMSMYLSFNWDKILDRLLRQHRQDLFQAPLQWHQRQREQEQEEEQEEEEEEEEEGVQNSRLAEENTVQEVTD